MGSELAAPFKTLLSDDMRAYALGDGADPPGSRAEPAAGRATPKRASGARKRLRALQALSVKELKMVDLFEALSHSEVSEALEKLSRRDWRPERRPLLPPYGRPGHRKLGSVTDAVVQVLEQADWELRYVDVHRAVEKLLGGPVARSSVKNALAKGCTGQRPRFKRVGRGRYRAV